MSDSACEESLGKTLVCIVKRKEMAVRERHTNAYWFRRTADIFCLYEQVISCVKVTDEQCALSVPHFGPTDIVTKIWALMSL